MSPRIYTKKYPELPDFMMERDHRDKKESWSWAPNWLRRSQIHSPGPEAEPTRPFFCGGCRKIELSGLYKWHQKRMKSGRVSIHGLNFSLNHLDPASACSLCQFIARASMVRSFKDPNDTLRHNSAIIQLGLDSLLDHGRLQTIFLPNIQDPVLLTVGEGRYGGVADRTFILSQRGKAPSKNYISFRNTSGKIDLRLVSQWIDFCGRNHKELCAHSAAPTSNLKVIDCKNCRVVDLLSSTTAYTALNYIWGPNQVLDGVVSGTLQNVPAIIEDAIYITTQLNFRYLWIDRYCISNTNARERHRLIQAMGNIY